jgi:hypothetical protein
MSLINSLRKKQPEVQPIEEEILDYKQTAAILGLSPRTVANGGAGTRYLQHRYPNGSVRYKKSQVLAHREKLVPSQLSM